MKQDSRRAQRWTVSAMVLVLATAPTRSALCQAPAAGDWSVVDQALGLQLSSV
jgi:hypothetical protein